MQLLFIVVAVLGWGVWGLFNKIALRGLLPAQMQIITVVSGLFFILPLQFASSRSIASAWTWPMPSVTFATLAACASWAATLAYYFALKQRAVTEVVGLVSIYPLVTVVLAFAILGEAFSVMRLGGVALICAGLWCLSR